MSEEKIKADIKRMGEFYTKALDGGKFNADSTIQFNAELTGKSMSERPTPETDAAEIAYNQLKADEVDAAMGMFGVKPKYGTPNGWKVARKLERERDEAREELKQLKDQYGR